MFMYKCKMQMTHYRQKAWLHHHKRENNPNQSGNLSSQYTYKNQVLLGAHRKPNFRFLNDLNI